MVVNKFMASISADRSASYRYFKDLHDLMESLLNLLKNEVYAVSEPRFLLLCLYGPLGSLFDKTWKLRELNWLNEAEIISASGVFVLAALVRQG